MKVLPTIIFSLLFFCSAASFHAEKAKPINWGKMDSEEKVRSAIDARIPAQSDYILAMEVLTREEHESIQGQGDSIIFFRSPTTTYHLMPLVVDCNWVLTFHFKNEFLTNYTCEKKVAGN